jgi:MtN3 and saliva related transmembrane protein
MEIPTLVAEIVGSAAATLTTICWLPQALRVIRTRDTQAISLPAYSLFGLGVALWLAYGLMLRSPPLIVGNIITLTLVLVILGMKIRHG